MKFKGFKTKAMENSHISLLLLFLFFFLLQTFAIPTKKSYIVYLGSPSAGRSSIFDNQLAAESHYDILGSVTGSQSTAKASMMYSYNRYINGFAAVLDDKEAIDLKKNPRVVSIFENKERHLHTTRTWNFLGVENDQGVPPYSIWNAAKFGQDTIVANLDSGIWPESKSFNDEGYGPVPSKWRGDCQSDPNFRCNRKLIGARYFNEGYGSAYGPLNASFNTARDHQGHGTHTLSTAAGNFVPGANVFGIGNGTAKGGAPKARVAAYKVCWPATQGGCFDADILAGIEAAIADGVDVISASLGTTAQDFPDDPFAIGAFHAIQKGIVVVCSAGNDGPAAQSVTNVAPWIFTVAASTIDRDFASYVALGNKKHIKGSSLSSKGLPGGKFYPLINAVDAKAANVPYSDAQLCEEGSLDPAKAKGKIVVCLRGDNQRMAKGVEVARVGGVGMILTNNEQSRDEVFVDPHFLPTSHVSYKDGVLIAQYINSTTAPIAFITRVKTELGIKPAPVMAEFSSRGPSPIDETILKPDITAPGVDILAAVPGDLGPSNLPYDKRRIAFNVESGTSMSCPHISGVVALLKTLYPTWSPAAIKSAIMTTAKTRDNMKRSILDFTQRKASPFEYGAGHVQPNQAMDPGLVYDATVDDYLNYLCARGCNETQLRQFSNKPFTCTKPFALTDLNYPSIAVPNLKIGAPLTTVNRRVKNVGGPGTYMARIKAPPGVAVVVEPSTLQFRSVGEEKAFKVVLQTTPKVQPGVYVFGTLVWSDGKHFVRSPIAVKSG